MPESENPDTEPTTEGAETSTGITETKTTETKPGEPDTFPRSYVESLRREAAEHRTRAADRDALAERLHRSLVAADGRLVADDVLPYVPEHLDDPDVLSAAIGALIADRPYLAKPQRPSGDVGQGKAAAPAPFSLIDALRGHG